MQGLDFQVRLKFDDKDDCEEEVNCFVNVGCKAGENV